MSKTGDGYSKSSPGINNFRNISLAEITEQVCQMLEKLRTGGMTGLRFTDRAKKTMIKLRSYGFCAYVRVASLNKMQGYLPLHQKAR
jgi:transcriptional regulator NrdR family protein